MVHLADVSRSHLYKCATIKEHHSQVYTCQPIQFTSIEYSFVMGGGDMAVLENGYRKTEFS